ncbi:hypothetical protein JVU11DRAFT_7122 [Chiua virens]|nr:hypothetical protein JVU11DRAFT_7122 [Chiua virens]
MRCPYSQDRNWDFHNVAILKLYSDPHEELFTLSSQTVTACTLTNQLVAVDVKSIMSVVAMIPRKMRLPDLDGVKVELFCQLSQPGLEASVLAIAYDIFTGVDEGEDTY